MEKQTITVNGRDYCSKSSPVVVVCVDGCEPDYLVAAAKAGVAPYLARIMDLAKQACVSVKFNGPDPYESEGADSYVGRFMCSQQRGKPYGTYTDQRVIAVDGFVYVVTSEIRTPPTAVAGTLAASADQVAALVKFMKKQQQSSALVRAGVTVCVKAGDGC